MTDQNNLEGALQRHRAGRLSEAEAIYRQILQEQPDHADALHLLGLIALQSGEYARAVELIETANESAPENPIYLSNLAEAYQQLNCPEKARACCEEALRLEPSFPAAQNNLGTALGALGESAAAEQCYAGALQGEPDSVLYKLNLGLSKLLHGDYEAGFRLFESRLEVSGKGGDTQRMLQRLAGVSRWRGESLEGKRLLVWTEQGLGDSVMMMRYLPLIKALGAAQLAVCCEASLLRLMEQDPSINEVTCDTSSADWQARFDFHAPMMSLPLCFDTHVDTIPARVPYVYVPSALREEWSRRLSHIKSPKVGLAWAGGKQTSSDIRRSIPFASFSPLLKKGGISFVSLQKGIESSQLTQSGRRISNWMDDCDDLLHTAALIEQLDLVISVDTAVAHLAGALGKPVWLLNRRGSEWRWMLERSDSPWYPSMRIFRQRQAGWTSLLEEVADTAAHELNSVPGMMKSTLHRMRSLFPPRS